MTHPPHTHHKGLTLIELMLALTVTVIIGAGLASLLTMISRVTAFDRDMRTGSLRAHAAQIRLQAYSEVGLCTVQERADGSFVMWLDDPDASRTINLLELRVFWVSPDGVMTCERVELPEAWTPTEIDAYNIELASNTDFFAAMLAERTTGYTSAVTIVDGISLAALEFDTAAVADASRLRYRFTQSFSSGSTTESLVALPLANHLVPEL